MALQWSGEIPTTPMFYSRTRVGLSREWLTPSHWSGCLCERAFTSQNVDALIRQRTRINQQCRAGHQHRQVAGAEQGDAGDVVRDAEAAERQGGADRLLQRLDP